MNKKISLDDLADYEGQLLWMAYFYAGKLDWETIDMMASDAASIEMVITHFFFDGDPRQAREYVVNSILFAGIADEAPDDVKEKFDSFQGDVICTAVNDGLNIDPFIEDYRPEEDGQIKEIHTDLKWIGKTRISGFDRHTGRRWRK